MKLRTALLTLCVMLSSVVVAHAQVKVRDHRPERKVVAQPVWDSNGWTSLGERTVQGKRDRDTIKVGAKDGTFSKITIVVEDSDLELFDVVVHFSNGETYSPTTRHYFKEGSRTGVIDLPGKARHIKKVVFKYGNLGRRSRARVQLWGFEVVEPPPPPPPPAAEVAWDRKGWTLLGETEFWGKRTKDTIKVGRYEGKFDQLVLVVGDNDVEVKKLTVHFANRQKYSPKMKHRFEEGSRSRVIDLPGNDRTIAKIDVAYKNLDRRGKASVQIWGRDTRAGDRDRDRDRPRWSSKGWDKLGEVSVDDKYDRESIKVGRDDGRFTKLTFVVEDNDVEIYDIDVVFGNREKLSLKDRLVFREGQRTGAIDLPGEKRFIKRIDFKFGKVGRGRAATVVVYGLPAKADPAPAPDRDRDRPWDDKGWTLIGEQEVNGGNDTDVFKVRGTARYQKLTVVVLDSDLVIDDIQVAFKKGSALKLDVDHAFAEGTRTRAIDLPGARRQITQIVVNYGNLSGGGRAKVQIWAK